MPLNEEAWKIKMIEEGKMKDENGYYHFRKRTTDISETIDVLKEATE